MSDPWANARLTIQGSLTHPEDFGFAPEEFAAGVQSLIYDVKQTDVVWEMEVDADGDLVIVNADDEEAVVVVSTHSVTFLSSRATPAELAGAEHHWHAQAKLAAQLFSRRDLPRLDACSLTLSIAAPFGGEAELERFHRRYFAALNSNLEQLAPGSSVEDASMTFSVGRYRCHLRMGSHKAQGEALLQIELQHPRQRLKAEQFFQPAFQSAVEIAQRVLQPALSRSGGEA